MEGLFQQSIPRLVLLEAPSLTAWAWQRRTYIFTLRITEKLIRGLTEENTQLVIISPLGYFKSPIGDFFLTQLGIDNSLIIFSLTLRYQTHISPIPNWQ